MKHYLSRLQDSMKENWTTPVLSDYRGEDFTYEDIARNIAKFHILFEKAGIKKGQTIAICARNCARWGISFLAVNTYEAVAVPILADFLPESIGHLVDHSDSVALFTDKDIWSHLDVKDMPGLMSVINVKDFSILYSADGKMQEAYENLEESFSSKYPMGFSRENISYPTDNAGDLAVINYTSGTTSAPKGVMLKYDSFTSMVSFCVKRTNANPSYSIVSMLPMAHMYGLAIELLYQICCGTHIYYLGKTPSPTLLLKAMSDVKPYMVVTVPLVMEKIYKSSIKPSISKGAAKVLTAIPIIKSLIFKKIGKKLQLAFGGSVQYFIMGGAALNSEVERYFRKMRLPYLVGYGMTEACPLLTYEDPDKYVEGSCGKPVDGLDIRIDSEDPQHIAGEIQVKGRNICIGYFKNPSATENAFTEDGYLRTGDLGIMDEHKNLFIKGRSKNLILSANGQNIYPEEVEAIINSQPYVAESVVVDRASRLVALVYLDKDSIQRDKLDEETVSDIPENIRVISNRNLPSYSQISKVEVVLTPFEKTPKLSIKRFLYK